MLERYAGLPRFPDGRIDFSEAGSAPVLSCFVRHGDEFLLLKRSGSVRLTGLWCPVMGFLDEPVSVRDKVLEELSEEIGVSEEAVDRVAFGEPFRAFDGDAGKTWHIHPVLVDLREKVDVSLDMEHEEARWVPRAGLKDFKTAPRVESVLGRLRHLLDE